MVDDLDNTVLADGEGETVTFALDGITYRIHLGRTNAAKLRAALQHYIAAGRKATGRRRVPKGAVRAAAPARTPPAPRAAGRRTAR